MANKNGTLIIIVWVITIIIVVVACVALARAMIIDPPSSQTLTRGSSVFIQELGISLFMNDDGGISIGDCVLNEKKSTGRTSFLICRKGELKITYHSGTGGSFYDCEVVNKK